MEENATEQNNHSPMRTKERTTATRSLVRAVLLASVVVTGSLLLWQVLRYWQLRTELTSQAQSMATEQANKAAELLGQRFADSMATTEDIAGELTLGGLPYHSIAQRLRSEIDADTTIDGITVAFATGAYSQDYDHYIVYVHRDASGEIIVEERESDYDYTLPPSDDAGAPQTSWYHDPIAQGPTWSDPFVATGAGKVLIEYGAPFYTGISKEEPAGVVAIDYSLDGMRQLMAGLDLGATGYGAVYSGSGAYLAHPVPELVAGTTVFDYFDGLDNREYFEAAQRALDGESASLKSIAQSTNQEAWAFFTPITSTGWVLLLELSAADFLPPGHVILMRQTSIVLTFALLLILGTALLLRMYEPTRSRLWLLSTAFSAIAVTTIVVTILLSRAAPDFHGVAVMNQTGLDRYMERLRQEYAEFGNDPLYEIPTGILIQAIRFPDTTSVALNGYLWQRIPHDSRLTEGVAHAAADRRTMGDG